MAIVTLPQAHPLHLIDYRQRAGITAEVAAQRARIGITTLRHAERGSLALMGGRLHAIARVYGVKPAVLVCAPEDDKRLTAELEKYKAECPPHRARITIQQWREDCAA